MTPGELIIQDVPKNAHLLRAFDFMCNMTHVANSGSQMKTLAMNTDVRYYMLVILKLLLVCSCAWLRDDAQPPRAVTSPPSACLAVSSAPHE